jgi:hypothetical protein
MNMLARRLVAAVVSLLAMASASVAEGQTFAQYIGHYPFDRVGHHSFIESPRVVARVRGVVSSAHVRDWVLSAGVGIPIARSHGYITASSCEQHNCGAHHWNIIVDDTASKIAVCYYDADARNPVRWFGDRPIVHAFRTRPTPLCPF